MKTLLLILFAVILLGKENFSQDYKGKVGVLIETKSGAELNTSAADYELDLMPNQSFTGYIYYFSIDNNPLTASLFESPEVNWLFTVPTNFTSNNCNDIKPVAFIFTAPSTVGTYNTTIIDGNNNWSSYTVLLNVTNSPSRNRLDSSITISQGQTINKYEISSYVPYTNLGCNPSYYPGPQRRVTYSLYYTHNILTINPSDFYLNQGTAITAVKTFSFNSPGNYLTKECRVREWSSFPQWIFWTLDVLTNFSNVSNEIPDIYSLSQNYPNTFNPITKIQFALPKSSFAKLIVYDSFGKELETLVNEQLIPGTYEADWNADKFSSGVYYCKLTAGDYTETKKMILIK